MLEQPRLRSEGIMTREFLASVVLEGMVLAMATAAAFHLGLSAGGAAAGRTMAFATLCFSRLLHGFSCKSSRPVLLSRRLWNNRVLLLAVAAGTALLGAVLLVPPLRGLLQAVPVSGRMLGSAAALAAGSLLAVQCLKWLRRRV